MATRTMIFGFVCVKTMEHGNSERILDALVVVKLAIRSTAKKVSQAYLAYLKVMHGHRFHLFFRHRIAFVFSRALTSCPSIMIICIQQQTGGASSRGSECGNGASRFFFCATGMVWCPPLEVGALRKLRSLRIGSGGTGPAQCTALP